MDSQSVVTTTKTENHFIEGDKYTVSVTTWSNCEGMDINVTGNDCQSIMSGSLTWDMVRDLTVILTIAKG